MPQQIVVDDNGTVRVIEVGPQGPRGSIGPPGPKGDAADVSSGDLTLAVASRSSGVVEGGVIRRVTGLIVPWTYIQNANPTDPAIGTAFLVQWDATINGGGGFGPQAQTGWFGPRGVFELEGRVRYGVDMTSLAIEPVGYFDGLRVSNTPGDDRDITPAWSYISGRAIIADDGLVTLLPNDTNDGGAAFIDNSHLVTENGGEIQGPTYERATVMSAPGLFGNVHVYRRIGFDAHDTLYGSDPFPFGGLTIAQAFANATGIDIDDDVPTLEEQYGLWARPMDKANHNVGVRNDAASVYTPLEVELDAVGDSLPINASILAVSATSALTLTSTPTIPDGLEGQRITVINAGTHPFVIQGTATLAGSNVDHRVRLSPKGVADFVFHDGVWALMYSRPIDTGIETTPGDTDLWETLRAPSGTSTAGFRVFMHGDTISRAGMSSTAMAFTDGTDVFSVSALAKMTGGLSVQDLFGTPTTLQCGKLRLRSIATMPTTGDVVGDMVVHNGVVKVCTVAGSPGTWAVVGSQT